MGRHSQPPHVRPGFGWTRTGPRLAHRRGRSVRLFSRNGHNFADRFPLAAAAIEALPVRSCVIDGEAIVCDNTGYASFEAVPRAVVP